jgi:tetratricopeptide (TPR) repeat protein/TolB-like protein
MPRSLGRPRFGELLIQTVFLLLMAAAVCAAQTVPPAKPSSAANSPAASGTSQRIYVVLPFENAGSPAKLDWLSEGLEELTIERLTAAGEQVYSHAGRAAELERYGLPGGSTFSRATMLRVAEDLDADYVIYGKYAVKGATNLLLEMRILSMNPLALRPPVQESGLVDSLMDLHTRLLWRTLSSRDGHYGLNLADFTKRQRPLRLDAFEQYSRGLQASDPDAKLRQLHEATRLEPDWPDANFALGEAYFAKKDYNAALAWFFKVPKTYERYPEALFFSGVCRLQLNQPDHAEEDFHNLQEALKASSAGADLPEVLNDLAIAQARQGKVAAAQASLKRATEMAPGEDDYSFNRGLLALQSDDAAGAANYFRDAAEREPDSAEDRALLILSLEKAEKTGEADQEREAAKEAFGPNGLPAIQLDGKSETLARLTRIKTELDLSGLRAEPGDAPASTASAAGASDAPVARIRRGRQELSAGNMDAAEKEFRAALAAEPSNAAAHRGLGEIERHQGKMDAAVKELQASLASRDSAEVRTMLAKIYLEQKKTDLARAEAEKALKLAPNYAEAKQLLDHLQNSKAAAKKPGGGGV